MLEVAVLEGDRIDIELQSGSRYMINPGSVGQPRDRDPRASFVLYDSDRQQVELRRLDYPVEKAQNRIRAANLPEILAERLSVGI